MSVSAEQRDREPHEHLLRDEDRVGRRDEHDRGGDERAEERAQADGDDRRAPERRDALGEARMVRIALGHRARRRRGRSRAPRPSPPATGVRGLGDVADVGLLAGFGDRVADDVRDALLGRARGERELLVVACRAVGVGQDAARVIDEAQRFLDVALAVARLGVVLADQPAQGRPHVLFGGGGQDPERFVQRCFHAARVAVRRSIMPLESWAKRPVKAS